MLLLSVSRQFQKFKEDFEKMKGTPGGIATLDDAGKVEVNQAPPAVINSYMRCNITDPAEIPNVLTSNIAWKGWSVGFVALGRTFILRENPYTNISNWDELFTTALHSVTSDSAGSALTLNGKTEDELSVSNAVNAVKLNSKTEDQLSVAVAANSTQFNGKTETQIRDKLIPIGFSYTEYPDSAGFNHKLPGDTLKNYDNTDCTYAILGFANQAAFDIAKTNCAYPGTTWKLAIQPADFERQAGTRADSNGKTIGAGFGVKQGHQMQGHGHQQYVQMNNVGRYGIDVYLALHNTDGNNNIPANAGTIKEAISDGTNGTPIVGVETRPTGTVVRKWKRIA